MIISHFSPYYTKYRLTCIYYLSVGMATYHAGVLSLHARMQMFLYQTTLVQRFDLLLPEGDGPLTADQVLGNTNASKPYTFRGEH